ncbi:AAA family ATPase [Aneurinibacillus uraniidurans]|uniref:AAA family ATPase n=1 Tax=Aneurinibacillus uraniidurans TaxID=2966586 RepID=UPI002349764C|nr:AAA family ATPase [Aneurinibacillus sp. B1]WCN39172.1 AAA family ATPase [Aneurinibacillus sp. B1]
MTQMGLLESNELNSTFYSIRTKTPATVSAILNKESNIEIDGLNIFKDQLHIGQIVFIVLGGDKAKAEITWETGLIGIGRIVEKPYDIGYYKKNFKIKISVEVLLNTTLSRHDLLSYADAYNTIGIGPMTKWEPNQAISEVEYIKALALVRAILDKYPKLEEEIALIFDNKFMIKAKDQMEYLIPQTLYFGQLPTTISESEEQYSGIEFSQTFDPDLAAIKSSFEMELHPLETLRNYVNIGKHLILIGPPGTGKTEIAERASQEGIRTQFTSGYLITTATADWSTFDTIGGYMPDNDGKLVFQEGIFLRSIREDKWLIIDEINRAEADKAFGQLFTVLSGKDVQLPFKSQASDQLISIKNYGGLKSYYDSASGTYYVGKNWRIIATMNTFDKNSLFSLSYAFMRRFAFIEIPIPGTVYMHSLIDAKGIQNTNKDFVRKVIDCSPKPIGPAVLLEFLEYIKISNETGRIEGLCSSILPQYEGLTTSEIKNFYKELSSLLSPEERTKLSRYLTDFFEMSRNAFDSINEDLSFADEDEVEDSQEDIE